MHALDFAVAPCLSGVPVTLEGGPCTPSWQSGSAELAWRGVGHGPERLVAIAFLTTSLGTRWLKSRRSWGNALFMEIHLPYRATAGHLFLSLASWVWPEVRKGNWDELGARGRGVLPADGEVQVPVLEWGWVNGMSAPVWNCDLPASSIPPRMVGETGTPLRVLRVPAASLALDLLFLPRREIRARPCGIWGLKRRCRDEVPEPLRHVLCFGRHGTWPPERKKGQRYGT